MYKVRPFLLKRSFFTTSYGVEKGQVYAKKNGFISPLLGDDKGFRRSVPLSDVRNANSHGLIVGDVTFETITGSTEISWNGVFLPSLKAKAVMAFKRAVEENKINGSYADFEDKNASRQRLMSIRDSLNLSENILMMPNIGGVFDKPLWRFSRPGVYPRHFFEEGQWIEKGDKICEFEIIFTGIKSNSLLLPVYSPVSGRILANPQNKGMGSNWGDRDAAFSTEKEVDQTMPLCVIQLPEGTAIDENTEYSYGEFADICLDNKEKLFQSGDFDFSDEHLQNLFDQMKSSDFIVRNLDFHYFRELAEDINLRYDGLNIKTPDF